MWYIGLVLSGLGTILGAVNIITTILTLRAPGMTMFRMPIFTWNILITALMVIMVFPILAAALLAVMADRVLGAHAYDATTNGPLLWQHLFWFFGHPEARPPIPQRNGAFVSLARMRDRPTVGSALPRHANHLADDRRRA
jgi:heme/copper-type cytochrome/quinol oxidase subunit 1